MWAQLITARLQQGTDHGLADLFNQLQATEEPGTGLIRSLAMQDPKNPGQVYLLAVFESEEKARAASKTPNGSRHYDPPER
jgi:quinol monooxygenase YgiN